MRGGREGETMSDPQTCPECEGRTIEFRGTGLNAQYRLCSRYKEPGHKTEEQCRAELAETRQAIRPSGRFA